MLDKERVSDAEVMTYRRLRMLVIAVADVAALVEIVVAMHGASHSGSDLTSVFVSSYFGMFLPTVALTILSLVLLRLRYGKAVRASAQKAEPEPDEGGLVV